MAAENKCQYCGKTLVQIPKQKHRRFYSDRCRIKWWNKQRKELNEKFGNTFICGYCGKEFKVYGKKNAKYCSVLCCCKVREKAYEDAKQKLNEEALSCRAKLQDLPPDCICPSCKWFSEGKRSCPCKEKAEKNL